VKLKQSTMLYEGCRLSVVSFESIMFGEGTLEGDNPTASTGGVASCLRKLALSNMHSELGELVRPLSHVWLHRKARRE